MAFTGARSAAGRMRFLVSARDLALGSVLHSRALSTHVRAHVAASASAWPIACLSWVLRLGPNARPASQPDGQPRRTVRLAVFVSVAVAPGVRSSARWPCGARTGVLAPLGQGTPPAISSTTSPIRLLSLMAALFLPFVQEAMTFLVAFCVAAVVDESARKPLPLVRTGVVGQTKPNDAHSNGSRGQLEISPGR